MPLAHFAVLCECPILEPITALPLHSVVGILKLVPELHCDLVVGEREEFLAQTVALLLLPFFGQELLNCSGAGDE